MIKKLPYYSNMSKDEIEQFLKQTLHNRFGDDTPILICKWTYKTKTEINFWIKVKAHGKAEKIPVLGIAYIENFNFRIVIKNSRRAYTEEWAQYVCDTLNAKAQDGKIEFDEKEYKAGYNEYWNRSKTNKNIKPKQEKTIT